jgi:signal transduction histidine kinase
VGNHKIASTKLRAGDTDRNAEKSAAHFPSSRTLTLQNWPVSWRLIAVIVLALVIGLVFGGLRVAAAAGSAAQFGRVTQLANLGQQVTVLVQSLENERDETAGVISGGNAATLTPWYNATNAAAARVQTLAAGVDASFPANIQASVATVVADIKDLGGLRTTAKSSQDALAVIANYGGQINDMITLNDQIAQGTSDASLANDERTLNSLALAKEEASQQRALLYNAFTQEFYGDAELQALYTAQSEQLNDQASFQATATPAERNSYTTTVAGAGVNLAEGIEDFILPDGNVLDIPQVLNGTKPISVNQAPQVWYTAMSDTVDTMQKVEFGVAGNIVARSQVLQRGAEETALFIAIITAAVLLLVLVATFVVARSLVLPLRRLRAGALDIATVQLPDRVRLLSEAKDPSMSLEVAPIDVLSQDEIGQVARAFDQVHSEAVRLAGNEAQLRKSFNAMFVSLSRRSQSLIERLARMIDSLEQTEEDPDRLANLFAMDHLVTRMRRNSENLLLLAGHEGARKWSEPVPLTDVARAATSEIEQYSRVTMKIQPGVVVSGQAVSDLAHLLAEIIENATVFSSKDTQVHVSARELASGGVLIEVSDSGVGVSEVRLAEINWRLDSTPVIDESVSRHMGLFAVARLAERHGVRVRLRAGTPRGLTALVWLPDSLAERSTSSYGGWAQTLAAQSDFQVRRASGRHSIATQAAAPDGQYTNGRADAPAALTQAGPATREPVQAASLPASNWFRSRREPAADTAGNGNAAAWAAPQAGDGADPYAQGRQAAQIIADPVRGDRTVAGLPTRVPRANLIPGSVGSGQADGHASGRATGSHETQRPATLPQRSPEVARSRLSGFQRGSRRAEGQTPRTGEGADR